MQIGVPKEIKNHEYRVGLTPAAVKELVRNGHDVLVERHAGAAIGFADQHYIAAGARIADDPADIFASAEMIVKVKEPQPEECDRLRDGQILFTYLHLAPNADLTKRLVDSGCVAIAYETVTDSRGGLPLLAPMSEVAGRMAIQAGARCLELSQGGEGILLSGVPGVMPARVLILGGGVVGVNAARMASGLGARVTLLDVSVARLRELDQHFSSKFATRYATQEAIEDELVRADLVIGAVLIPGSAAPKLVTRQMLKLMKPGAVLVDVAIDQGGCFESSHPTTHQDPTFVVDGVVHYCVANMPGAVARTATQALSHATLPFVQTLAANGWKEAMRADLNLQAGLNVCHGKVAYPAVAMAHGYPCETVKSCLA